MKQRNEITTEDILKTLMESRKTLIKARQGLAVDYMVPEPSQIFDGGMTCIISAMHHTIKEYRNALRKQRDGIFMSPRGMGADNGPCFVCGDIHPVMSNFASFVRSKESGEQIVQMFRDNEMYARLDWREWEPHWIQVKVQACDNHNYLLEPLMMKIAEYGFITNDMLVESRENVGKC